MSGVKGVGRRIKVLVHLRHQRGVTRHVNAELTTRERLPLHGGNLGIKAVARLEDVALHRAVVADGVELVVLVGVDLGALAASRDGAQHVKQAVVAATRRKEQLRVGNGVNGAVLVEGIVATQLHLLAKVAVTLHVAGILTCVFVLKAIALGNVDRAVVVGYQRARILGGLHEVGGVQAVLGVVEVGHKLQVAHVGVDGGNVAGHAHGNPLMTGELLEVPYLGGVANPQLVAVLRALLIDNRTQQLNALARRAGLGEHHVGNVVLANAVVQQRVHALDALVVGSGEGGVNRHALLVGARLGVGVGRTIPVFGEVAHVGVAEGRARRRAREVDLGVVVGAVLPTPVGLTLGARLDAKLLEIAVGSILGPAIDGLAACGELGAHIHLGAGKGSNRSCCQRGGRSGHNHRARSLREPNVRKQDAHSLRGEPTRHIDKF